MTMTAIKDRTTCCYTGIDGRSYCSGGNCLARTQCLFAETTGTTPDDCVFCAVGHLCGGVAASRHNGMSGPPRAALEAARRYELQRREVLARTEALYDAQAERQRLDDVRRAAQDAAAAEETRTPVRAYVRMNGLVLELYLTLPAQAPVTNMMPRDQWHGATGGWRFFRDHQISDTGWSVSQWVKGALASASVAGFAVDVEPLRASLSTLRQQVDEITDQFDLVIRDLDKKEKTK